MEEIDYRYFDDNGFTIKLVGPPHTIDVDTLIDTLRGFADALKEINSVVNPKYELEVLIDEVAPGSIQIIIRLKKHFKKHKTKYIAAGLAGHLAYDVVAGVFGNYMYDQLKADKVCETEHHPDYVIVKGDGCNQRISFQAYQFRQAVADNPKVAASVSKAIKAADKDKSVDGVSIQASPSRNEAAASPSVYIPREKFEFLEETLSSKYQPLLKPVAMFDRATQVPQISGSLRSEVVRANLTIIKVVFKRSKRKWQFNWQGINISAAIADPEFFDKMEERKISLSQGDALDADLSITQHFIEDANVWENVAYEVVKVHSVRVAPTQTTFELSTSILPPGVIGLPGPPRMP